MGGVVGDLLSNVPPGSPAPAAPLSALATVVVIGALTLKAPAASRLWAPVIGVGAGAMIGGWFGLYDLDRVAGAAWVDLPSGRWPGFDLTFGPTFWALLPAFLLVAVIAAFRTMSSAVAVQGVPWRGRRAVDFRSVQGAMTMDGVGKPALRARRNPAEHDLLAHWILCVRGGAGRGGAPRPRR